MQSKSACRHAAGGFASGSSDTNCRPEAANAIPRFIVTAGPQPVGNTIHGGVGLRVNY